MDAGGEGSRPVEIHDSNSSETHRELTAWKDYHDGERPIAEAIKRLGEA